ncbi:M36 family metallopeptidase [Roseateles sp. P5_E1]
MASTRELDTRKTNRNPDRGAARTVPGGGAADAALRDSRRTNTLTGVPAVVKPAAAHAPQGSLIEKALAFVSKQPASFGFDAAGAPAQFVPDPVVNRTTAGSAAVHLQQTHDGVPVFQMSRTVRFDRRDQIVDAVGDNAIVSSGFSVLPRIDAASAVGAAARHIADTAGETHKDAFGEQQMLPTVDLSGFKPVLVSSVSSPARPTVFEKGPFESPIQASLVVFQQPQGSRLAWQAVLTLPDHADQYLILVAADDTSQEVLYSRSLMHSALAQGSVYEFSPGVADRRVIAFPRALDEYPAVPAKPLLNFPSHWVSADKTIGNTTRATLNTGSTSLSGVIDNGVLRFSPQGPFGDEQKLLNIFYFCNYMHDCLFILGFDELAGNFQQTNFSQGGSAGDAVRARAHSGAVFGTANMSTPPDGTPPVMNMGLVTSTGRHTAFDADVVFHEYVHGLTNRLVGGPLDFDSLGKLQSGGMGEGWSDYFALTIQNFFREEEKVVTGDWVVNSAAGIRSAPYDDAFPNTYGDLRSIPEVHDIGEVWCAALMMMTRRIRAALGDSKRGYRLSWQIVVDGLKLLPADPTFLQSRDSILRALDDSAEAGHVTKDEHRAARKAAWQAFAHFGMGVDAQSDDADDVDNIVADKTLPNDL